MKQQLTHELEELLDGKDLAAEAVAQAAEAKAEQTERLAEANNSPELKPAWTHQGSWMAVASDARSGLAYASALSGALVALDASGTQKAEQKIDDAGMMLRTVGGGRQGPTRFSRFQSLGGWFDRRRQRRHAALDSPDRSRHRRCLGRRSER